MLSLRHLSGEETALAAPCETTDAGLVPMVSDDGAWLVIVVFAPGVPGCRLFAALNAPCPTFAEILGVDDEGLGLGGWRGEGLVLVPRTTSGGREVVLADLRPLLAGGSPCLSSLYREDGDRMTAACVLRTGEIVLIDRAPDGGHAFRCLVDGRTVDVPADPGTALAAWTVAEGRLLATMSSWTAPACLVAFDAESRRFIRLRETGRRLGVDVSRAAVESDDGVRVPVTLIRSAGGGDESARPCLLWGYGGFGISLRPNCMMGLEPWFAAGGMLAIAHVRGGGEGGTAWHEAARGAAKLTSFTDFIAVARWLTASRQTTPERLCAWGSSAGGLLVLGSAVLAPDLFRAVIADNPVTDIARFTRFADDGRFWTVEFGDTARDPAALAAAARWSPLHNLQSGRDYPATLISVSRNDQRVSPIHGRKMTAALQATESRGPHLLMERDGVGHGGMATVGDAADAMATVLRFIAWATDSHLSLTCPQ